MTKISLFFRCLLLWCLDDVLICAPVVDHAIELVHGIDFVPAHVDVAGLTHLDQELVELLARIAIDVHSVDQNAFFEELKARHAVVGHQNWCVGELGSVGVQPGANLNENKHSC